jgi:hypothetical protein
MKYFAVLAILMVGAVCGQLSVKAFFNISRLVADNNFLDYLQNSNSAEIVKTVLKLIFMLITGLCSIFSMFCAVRVFQRTKV